MYVHACLFVDFCQIIASKNGNGTFFHMMAKQSPTVVNSNKNDSHKRANELPKKENETITILFVYNTILWFLLLQHLVRNFRAFAITSTMRMFDNICVVVTSACIEYAFAGQWRKGRVLLSCRECHRIIFTSRFACRISLHLRERKTMYT